MRFFWAGGADQRGAHQGLSVHPADERPGPIPETSQRPALLPQGLPPAALSERALHLALYFYALRGPFSPPNLHLAIYFD